MKYIPGKGPSGARIAIVGDFPSLDDEALLTPFQGGPGKLLTQLLTDSGIRRDECWTTNVIKYNIITANSKNKTPLDKQAKALGIDVDKCINELRIELNQIRPNIIIALGGFALYSLTGRKILAKQRGSIDYGLGFKTIGTYHPRDLYYQDGEVTAYWNRQIAIFDMKRALKHSNSPTWNKPKRALNICKDSGQLYDFIQRNKHIPNVSVDIEAHKCIPICIGLSFNRSEGLTIPLWNSHGISTIPSGDLTNIWGYLAEVLADKYIIGQNFGYDRDKIKRLGFITKGMYSDTMLKSFVINPELPKNLAFNVSVYTEEPYYKDEGMYEGSLKNLFEGCALDACVTKEVDDAMQKDIDELGLDDYYRQFMIPLHELYGDIENVGFRVSDEIHKELITKYVEWDEDIRYKLFQITGEYVNTGSPTQVAKLLYETWKIPARKGTGEEVLTTLLNNVVKDPVKRTAIELILEDRRVKKTYNSYLMSPADYDGRMRTSYFLCLKTGRSATSQQEPPIRPWVEYKDGKVNKHQARGMAFQTITKHGDIGADVRKMFIPDEGEIFLQADSSQAEARVIFLLAEDYEALELIDTHDYHALTASWFVGGTENDWSKKILGYEHVNRFLGKTLRHAGHLGAGAKRAAIEVNTQARKNKKQINISEAKAKKALEIFHAKQPKIRGIFHHGIRQAIEKTRRLAAPVPYGISAKVGGIRTFFERYSEDLFRDAFSYIPQRTVSENTKGAALRIKKRIPEIKIICEAHDALLVSVPIMIKNEVAEILRYELERPIDFSTCTLKRGTLVIPCDVEEGMNYKDFTKFDWSK